MTTQSGVSFSDTSVTHSDRSVDPNAVISQTKKASPNNSTSFRSSVLRSNLTRDHKNRDPLFYYEVQKVLGVGSMGSVVKVRKRDEVVGGSARKSLQGTFRREKLMQDCVNVPVVGWIAKHCLWNPLGNHEQQLNNSSSTSSVRNLLSLGSKSSPFKPVGGSNESGDSLETPKKEKYEMNYAMKSIHLSRVTDQTFVEELRNEVSVLKALDHPHIVRCIETFEHRHQIFIIMESCSGGDLYSRDPYTEDEAARIISSILSAISYMHQRQIIHRDLKYENVLFVNDSAQAEIKLIDFGLSKRYGKDEELMEGVGTIYTMAPEVLKGNYTEAADLWSVGVLAYMLLSSQMPFFGKKRRHIVELIMNCRYNFKGRRWKRVSKQAKAFVEDLLVLDCDDRATADCAYRSTWLNRRQMETVRNPHEEENEKAQQSLLKYAGYSKLKKVAMMVVAHKSNTEEIGILRKIFSKYDTNKSGDITYQEFVDALSSSGYTEEQLKPIFEAVDIDGSGHIRYTEFLAATLELHGAIREELLAEAFDRLDCDDSGYISAANLKEILGDGFESNEIDDIIKEATGGKHDKISYSEFLKLWEEKKENEREQMIQELTDMEAENKSVSSLDFEDEAEARAEFLGKKISSSAKLVMSETPSRVGSGGSKHVGFEEGVVLIPTQEADI
ncbi:MAP kinase-activated protein kinase 2 (Fragment) [Seminavis robusta]|uniref:MAP kinase-activated protein kinase 2 n=1 Tax=Seminavis robusta TaxID=568900 RepID=A0A9N8HT49_9STRA